VNRLLAVILLLMGLLCALAPSHTIAWDTARLHDFDRDECYDNCPCGLVGFEQACGECVQRCEREFWKDFDRKFKNKDED